MKTIKLSDRLSSIAELAGKSDTAADVGTDHAYIPIWLIQNGMAGRVIASDIKKGPLDRAKNYAREYGVESCIDFVQSDGIKHLEAESAETVIIAGMGGETIADILSKAAWISGCANKFVLQPMTKTGELIRYIYDAGLHIEDARLSEDCGEVYIAISVKSGRRETPSNAGLIVPRKLIENRDKLLGRYVDINIKRLEHAIYGMKTSKSSRDELRLEDYDKLREELNKIKGEL
jgi:tRNA (adenine22-N1)-methyltransferase